LYLTGVLLMIYNVWRTVAASRLAQADLSDPSCRAAALEQKTPAVDHEGKSVWQRRHRWLEGAPAAFTALTLVAVAVGGIVEYVPLAAFKSNIPAIASVKPYTPLELEGRDIYIREGCYNCHSQMVRPFRDEVLRYGEHSKPGEFVYDRPFQFGSKRTGPDLHRVGGKYPHFWHLRHMSDPKSTSSESIMPAYPWLEQRDLDTSLTQKKLSVLRRMGAPYAPEVNAAGELQSQAQSIVGELQKQGAPVAAETARKEIIALIAYLQRLGTDIKRGMQ